MYTTSHQHQLNIPNETVMFLIYKTCLRKTWNRFQDAIANYKIKQQQQSIWKT